MMVAGMNGWEYTIMRREIWLFAADDNGSAAIEYGLIAAGIVLAFLAVFLPFWDELAVIANHVTAGLARIVAMPHS